MIKRRGRQPGPAKPPKPRKPRYDHAGHPVKRSYPKHQDKTRGRLRRPAAVEALGDRVYTPIEVLKDSLLIGAAKLDLGIHDWRTLGFPQRVEGQQLIEWIFTPACRDLIFEYYAIGASIPVLCVALELSPIMLTKLLYAFPKEYAEAKAGRAQLHIAHIERDVDDVRHMRMPPDAARVCIAAEQWLAAKRDRREFGEVSRHELTGADGQPIKVRDESAINNVMSRLLRGAPPITIDNRTGGVLGPAPNDLSAQGQNQGALPPPGT